jgi:hypothetical protein
MVTIQNATVLVNVCWNEFVSLDDYRRRKTMTRFQQHHEQATDKPQRWARSSISLLTLSAAHALADPCGRLAGGTGPSITRGQR